MYIALYYNEKKFKNNLEKAFAIYLQKMDRTQISSQFINSFIEQINNAVISFSDQYKTCKPLSYKIQKDIGYEHDYVLFANSCTLRIIKVKNRFNPVF